MELKRYLFPLFRWWWLILAATVVTALTSFLVTWQQAPIYQARTTLMIGRTIEDPNPSSNEFYLSQQLAITYADVANRELVRNSTMQALGWNWLPRYQANALPNSQFIEILVSDTDPQRAAQVANELANQLILQSPTAARSNEQSHQEFVNSQLDQLEIQIGQTQADIETKQQELGEMTSARAINDAQNQITALQNKLTTLRDTYASLLLSTQRGAVNTLSVVEPAAVPLAPMGPAKALAVVVSGAIGFALAVAAAYLLEYLDDTLKTPDDIERELGYPVIGYISDLGEDAEQPIVARKPRHPVTEAFRSLRTNLEFSGVAQPVETLLITSADAQEGKTSLAANLAVITAQSDKKVTVVDADLRSPTLHQALGVPNDFGLSDIFLGRVSVNNATYAWENGAVRVITGGPVPPNPAELLASKKMEQILGILRETSDLVIIDGPPFVVADASLLASKVDGVLLVVRPGYTRTAAARVMAEQLKRSNARVVGIVLNRIPRKLIGYFNSGQVYLSPYYYGGRYYRDESLPQPNGSGGRLKDWQRTANRYIQAAKSSTRPNAKS